MTCVTKKVIGTITHGYSDNRHSNTFFITDRVLLADKEGNPIDGEGYLAVSDWPIVSKELTDVPAIYGKPEVVLPYQVQHPLTTLYFFSPEDQWEILCDIGDDTISELEFDIINASVEE